MRRWLTALVALTAACASGRGTPAVPEPLEPEPEAPPAVEVDDSAVGRAREAMGDGELGIAAHIADSLFETWVGLDALPSGPVEDLVDLLDTVGEELDAARLMVRTRHDLDGGERGRLRDLTEQLTVAELDMLWTETPSEGRARSVVGAELARALALGGRSARAEALAVEVLERDPDRADRDKAAGVADGDVEPLTAPVRIGVVLPGTGRFAAVGEQLLEGALLAVEARRRTVPDGRAVELVVLDDSSRVEIGVRHIEDLFRSNVVAVLGPVRTEGLVSAASRRTDDDLLLISPTASAGQGTDLNVYTAWDRERRESDVAVAVAAWMADEMMLRKFGVLHPEDSGSGVVEAVREVVEAAGGTIRAAQVYAPDSTTFEAPITALARAEPDAVIVLADRPRTVLQIAPQLVYYGLRRWVTGGDANWSDPSVARRLDASYADFRLVGTYVDRLSPETPWARFENLYEEVYRKSLPDNMFVALGYDAMSLILAGTPMVGPERRGAIGRAIRRADPHQGATGDLRVDERTGELRRDVFVRVLMQGELVEPDRVVMMEWAEDQRELEEFLKALEEEKAKEQEERDRGPSNLRGGEQP